MLYVNAKMGQALGNTYNKQMKFEAREEYFIKNGGILLEKHIALSKGQGIGPRQVKIFSTEEIQKATNCYDPDLFLGSMLRGMVYKGILDNHVVTIRSPPELDPNPELIDHVLTEVSAGMMMNHSNTVKLNGCCLETYVPIPIYEFCPNSSLYQNLHGGVAISNSLKWGDRLRVAADIAHALSYMHNALSKPVVHRNVHSEAILLDESIHAKLANSGYCVMITPGESSQRWPLKGTPGYIDLEYVETQEVTDKCDVYSFGVLMLELLTRRQPLMMANDGRELVDAFVSAV